jgi:hypothetical protein
VGETGWGCLPGRHVRTMLLGAGVGGKSGVTKGQGEVRVMGWLFPCHSWMEHRRTRTTLGGRRTLMLSRVLGAGRQHGYKQLRR